MIYSLPIRTLAACEGRYPTDEEEGIILGWAGSIHKRLHAANIIAHQERDLVRTAIEQMKQQYTRFASLHERAFEKGERDLQLLLRYVVQGMIVDDAEMPREKLFIWYGTIIRSLGLTPKFTRDACQALYTACEKQLPEETFDTAQPFLKRMVDDVPDFPEPDRPAVDEAPCSAE
ncbi:MAG: hypothetical protein ACRC8S_20080 [Fimbriiglobus sp.]